MKKYFYLLTTCAVLATSPVFSMDTEKDNEFTKLSINVRFADGSTKEIVGTNDFSVYLPNKGVVSPRLEAVLFSTEVTALVAQHQQGNAPEKEKIKAIQTAILKYLKAEKATQMKSQRERDGKTGPGHRPHCISHAGEVLHATLNKREYKYFIHGVIEYFDRVAHLQRLSNS